MWRFSVMVGLVALLISGSELRAQDPDSPPPMWDSPLLVPPAVRPGLGLFLADMAGPGMGVGAIVTFRSVARPAMGFRLGIGDARDGVGAIAGVDMSGAITREAPDFPLDIDWVFGAGLGVSDWVRISFPLALTVGHTFRAEGANFTPYLSPRVVLDAQLGDDDDLDLDFAIDIGLDLMFAPTWLIRFGGTFVNRSAVAIGVVF